jgi:transcriptional regulator with XRE-family HTH domain
MPTLQDLLKRHLSSTTHSTKTLAEKLGMSYPTLLSLVNEGGLPRKQAHRDALRQELAIDASTWAVALAASQKDAIDIPAEGPLTLQQLVTREMLSAGYTEQSLAHEAGLPYPTIMGVTRKGAVPRAEALAKIATTLGVELDQLKLAAERTKVRRDDAEPAPDAEAIPSSNGPHLAQRALDGVTRSGVSIAAFAREHDLPYISFSRLIAQGALPADDDILNRLASALGLDEPTFHTLLAEQRAHRRPGNREDAARIAGTPLQAALRNLLEQRQWTLQAFAEAADLSVVTAGRLVRDGELPGRMATHTKLRSLLNLSQDDYDLLVARSRQQVLAAEVKESTNSYRAPPKDERESSNSYVAPAAPRSTPINPSAASAALEPTTAVRAAVQAVAHQAPKDAELMELIERLNPAQRRALDQFLRTLV